MLAQRVDAIVQSVTRLRSMPSNVTRILKEIEKPNVTINFLVGLISLDPALAALVLQTSNSASLGYARPCSTLHEALMHIGLQRLKAILLASSATDILKCNLVGYRLGAGELWHHSLVTGVAAEWLAQALRYPTPDEAYVSGLLHDMGKFLLDQYVLDNYEMILEYVEKNRLQLWQVEEKMIGIDHARVGGMIAQRWNFPVVLVDAIRFHHTPSFARINQALPAIVNLADAFAGEYRLAQVGLISSQIHPETLNILKLDAERVLKLQEGLRVSGRFPHASKTGQL